MALKRRVVKKEYVQRALVAEKERYNLNEKRLRAAQGTNSFRDGATGSPVIEIGYKHMLPYLKRLIW